MPDADARVGTIAANLAAALHGVLSSIPSDPITGRVLRNHDPQNEPAAIPILSDYLMADVAAAAGEALAAYSAYVQDVVEGRVVEVNAGEAPVVDTGRPDPLRALATYLANLPGDSSPNPFDLRQIARDALSAADGSGLPNPSPTHPRAADGPQSTPQEV